MISLTQKKFIMLGEYKLVSSVSGGAAIALSIVCTPFVLPALRRICLPFVPATPLQIKNVFTALKDRSGSLIDLGSGDGRIVSKFNIYFHVSYDYLHFLQIIKVLPYSIKLSHTKFYHSLNSNWATHDSSI